MEPVLHLEAGNLGRIRTRSLIYFCLLILRFNLNFFIQQFLPSITVTVFISRVFIYILTVKYYISLVWAIQILQIRFTSDCDVLAF